MQNQNTETPVNLIYLQGVVENDPTTKKAKNGNFYTYFNLKTEEEYTDDSGEIKKATSYHNIRAWNKLSLVCKKNVQKGKMIQVKGKLKHFSIEEDGIKKYFTNVEPTHINFQ